MMDDSLQSFYNALSDAAGAYVVVGVGDASTEGTIVTRSTKLPGQLTTDCPTS